MSFQKVTWEYKGVRFPLSVTKENLDAMPSYHIRDDDIVVASFGKTGSTWLLRVILKILEAAGEIKDGVEYECRDVGPIEMIRPSATQPGYIRQADMPSPRVLKTHLPIQFAPLGVSEPEKKVKVLVPMRNPKDTVVSLFHFAHNMWKLRDFKATIPWDEFAQNFIIGKVGFGDYCDHVLGWWQMRDDPHFLFIKYEDMKKDYFKRGIKEAIYIRALQPSLNRDGGRYRLQTTFDPLLTSHDLFSAVKTIVTFLEVDLNESTMKDVADACTFDNMKAALGNSEIPEIRMLVRKGIVGDWKNMLSPEQSKAFDAWYEKKLGGTGINFEFE
ncbi:sulfotransferase 1 [Branchiostoma belcheri]|nr:sulfotransferase 1 [Branchiostoma belcheri]